MSADVIGLVIVGLVCLNVAQRLQVVNLRRDNDRLIDAQIRLFAERDELEGQLPERNVA